MQLIDSDMNGCTVDYKSEGTLPCWTRARFGKWVRVNSDEPPENLISFDESLVTSCRISKSPGLKIMGIPVDSFHCLSFQGMQNLTDFEGFK